MEKIVLDAKTTLEAIADRNPPKLKLNSVVHDNAIPKTITKSDITVRGLRCSRKTTTARIAEKRGSAALIVCINDADDAAVDIFVRIVPTA